jgi:hypothetical protein
MCGYMEDLEYISERDISEEFTASFFPSLNSLKFRDCPNLKGWWRSASTPDHQQHQHHHSLPSFPLLSSLEIDHCPNLISMPLFPNLEKLLCSKEGQLEPFATDNGNGFFTSLFLFLFLSFFQIKGDDFAGIKG